MAQISGTIRGVSPPQLTTDAFVDRVEHDGIQVAAASPRQAVGLAAVLLRDYLRGGAATIPGRRADCTVVVADANSRTLVLARDFAGTTPLYYAAGRDEFAFGTRIADVLDGLPIDTRPNRAALAALLVDRAAASPGQTYFENIHAVPPGGMLVRKEGNTSVLAGSASLPATLLPNAYGDAVAQFREHLSDAVMERLDRQQPTAVFVSGGLDSAAVLCLAAQHADVIGITYGPQDGGTADESRYIDVLRAHGLRVERVPFYPTLDVPALEQSIRESEIPLHDVVAATLQRARRAARECGAHTALVGTWGDQVLAPFPPPHLARLSPWRAARVAHRYQHYLADVSLPEVRRALVRQSWRAHAPGWLLRVRRRQRRRLSLFDELAREFPASSVHDVPTSYADAVWMNVRAPRQVQTIESSAKWGHADAMMVRLPFLDRELLSFLTSLPADLAYHDHRLKPLLRDGLRGIVPEPILARRDKGDYTAVIERGALPVKTMLELVEELRRPIEFGLMTRQRAAKTLAHLHQASNIAAGQSDVADLLAVDTWLRLFFQSKP